MTNCPLPGSDGYGQEIHYPQAGPVELLPSSDVLLQDPKTGLVVAMRQRGRKHAV